MATSDHLVKLSFKDSGKNILCKTLAAVSLHDFLNKVPYIRFAIAVFSCIRNVIGLYKDLPVQAVNSGEGVMVPHKESYSVNLYLRHFEIREKRFDQRSSFLFLMFPVCITIFITA